MFAFAKWIFTTTSLRGQSCLNWNKLKSFYLGIGHGFLGVTDNSLNTIKQNISTILNLKIISS